MPTFKTGSADAYRRVVSNSFLLRVLHIVHDFGTLCSHVNNLDSLSRGDWDFPLENWTREHVVKFWNRDIEHRARTIQTV